MAPRPGRWAGGHPFWLALWPSGPHKESENTRSQQSSAAGPPAPATPDPVLVRAGAPVPKPAPLGGATARELPRKEDATGLNVRAAVRMRDFSTPGRPSAPARFSLTAGRPLVARRWFAKRLESASAARSRGLRGARWSSRGRSPPSSLAEPWRRSNFWSLPNFLTLFQKANRVLIADKREGDWGRSWPRGPRPDAPWAN